MHKITVKDYNRTRLKSKLFTDAWVGKRIRTRTNGEYNGLTWKKNEVIDFVEVLALKLYTDFEKLQFELKKSIRSSKVFAPIDDPSDLKDDDIKSDINQKRYQQEIQEEYFHWLRKLSVVLRKYGHKIKHTRLYHGVNSR